MTRVENIFSIILFAVLLFCVSFKTPEAEWTQDLGRHIKLGEIIVKTESVPKTNLFSYTEPDFPFINHHWLSEVVFYSIYVLSADNGLQVLKLLCIFASFGLIIGIRGFKSLVYIFPVAIISVLIFRDRVDVRPEIFGFLFFSYFLYVLTSERIKSTKWVLSLCLIEILWVNTHITFIFGPILVLLYLISVFVASRSVPLKKYTWFLLVFIVPILNPNWLQGALYPLKIFANFNYLISENQSVFYLNRVAGAPLINSFTLSAIVLCGFLWFVRPKNVFMILGILFFMFMSFMQVRHQPFYVLFLLCFAVNLLLPYLQHLPPIYIKTSFYIFAALSVIYIFVYSTNMYYLSHNSDRNFYFGGFNNIDPARRGAEFLISNAPNAHIFNNFDIGSYLDYKLYPLTQVFVDSRPEAYPSQFWDVYRDSLVKEKDWEALDEKYKFNAAFISITDNTPWGGAVMNRLFNNPNWRLVYFDDFSAVYFKENYKPAVSSIKREDMLDLAFRYKDHRELMRISTFFDRIGLKDDSQKVLKKAYELYPYSCGFDPSSLICRL